MDRHPMACHPMACHPAKVILAAVAGLTICGSLLFVVLHDTNHIHLTMRGSPTTQLFHDLGNELVGGYSCTGITTHAPCSPSGGECKGVISQSCSCNPGFSGYPCDWGPPVADRTTRYSNSPPMTPTEELRRIAMAYGFSNAIYQEQRQMTAACPGFGRGDQAIGTAQLHVVSDDASTHAGASLILPGNHSPSGRAEAIFGFRGTEFGKAMQEISGCVEQGDQQCSYDGLKTVMTDLNIQRQNMSWTAPDGTLVDLGYMHKGFYEALQPFLHDLLSNATAYVQGARYLTEPGDVPIINIVGHSLGGALAQIFASIVQVVLPEARIYLTTFGSPRVGSARWVESLSAPKDTHILRVVAGNDVVSLLPTSVGRLDSVIHAGPQLTVGWENVPANCTSMVQVKDMFKLILGSSDQSSYIECAISSVSQFHLNYSYSLQPYLESQGYSGYQWCKAAGLTF